MESKTDTTEVKKELVEPQENLAQNENDMNSQNQTKKETLEEKLQSRSALLSSASLQFFNRLDAFYKDYYLSAFQRFAVTKFIKDNIGKAFSVRLIMIFYLQCSR